MLSLPSDLHEIKVEKQGMYVYPPIPFVPVKESADVAMKLKTIKLPINMGLIMSYLLWMGGTPEGLLCHVQSALVYVSKKDYTKPMMQPLQHANRS